MDLVTTGFISAATVATVELINRARAKDWQGVLTIILAGLIGLGAGYFNLAHLTPLTGLIAGFAASGVHQIATASSGK